MQFLRTTLAAVSVLAVVTIGSAALAQGAASRPPLTSEQAIQLFEEAGFRLEEGRPVNRCGGASNPRVAFVDLNGDGRAEVHLADVDPRCYGKPGAYFAILSQQSDGHWTRLIAEDGIVGFDSARTSGWNNLLLEPRDSDCPGVRRFGSADYGAPSRCSPYAQAVAIGEAAVGVRSAGDDPISQTRLFDWEEDQTPEAKAFPVSERDVVFRAAGVQHAGGGRWTACIDDPSGHSEAQLAMVQDVNGDGLPEAMIRDGGSYCNGFVGVSSTVLTRTPAGTWNVMLSTQGFVSFLTSRGVAGFPDIEIDLPGFCFPYRRWNGTDYALAARLDKDGRPCQPF